MKLLAAEHGTLFTGQMVRALRAGRKTETRRIVTRANSLVDGDTPAVLAGALGAWPALDFSHAWVDRGPSPAGNPGPYLKVPDPSNGTVHRVYPRVQPGHYLWVRETWRGFDLDGDRFKVEYAAGGRARIHGLGGEDGWSEIYVKAARRYPKWQPSLFMPRSASRILLRVVAVEPQRLQAIRHQDALAEGFDYGEDGRGDEPLAQFGMLWHELHGKKPGEDWLSNPWVWVRRFQKVRG